MTALPTLSPALVPTLATRDDLTLPNASQLALPERAVQFGTGALLRGLVDALLDEANRQGQFGGRVVMIGSTGSGRDRAINDQGGLFTLVVQGLVDGGDPSNPDCPVAPRFSNTGCSAARFGAPEPLRRLTPERARL